MTVRVYYSTDASAPILSGSAGALITVLDACLVNGYGSNAAAGWTKLFTPSALIGAYQQGAGSNNMVCRVNDTGTGIGFSNYGTQIARICGYRSMSDINTGVFPFPTQQQSPTSSPSGAIERVGVYVAKSNASNSTARTWAVAATEKAFWLWIDYANSPYTANLIFFGDLAGTKPGDNTATLLLGNIGHIGWTTGLYGYTNYSSTMMGVNLGGHHLAGSWTQIGGGQLAMKTLDFSQNNQSVPNVVDGRVAFLPWWVGECNMDGANAGVIRGYIPGLLHASPTDFHSVFDVYEGVDELAGRSFQCWPCNGWRAPMVEISDTW